MTTSPIEVSQEDREQMVIDSAIEILQRRIRINPILLSDPENVHNYLTVQLSQLKREVFGALYIDVNLRLISDEVLFMGSYHHCNVYPRELLKRALELDATSVLFYHNHPGGTLEASTFDRELTAKLIEDFRRIEVRVIDHIIVAGAETFSFYSHGILK